MFVAAISGIRSYTYRGKPVLAWLYRIAHNLVGDYRRKVLREKQQSGALALDGVHSLNGSTPGGDPAALVEDLDLKAALQNLPDTQRDVLILRFFVGLSTPEIAQVMDKQPTAVYSLQARAVASLRTVLE